MAENSATPAPAGATGAAAPGAAAPPAGDKQQWPSKSELEKWLMNSAKDADRSASFLRKMIQMNPGYGGYLAADEELAGIVQLFAKRFRSKLIGSDDAVQRLRNDVVGRPLWEPLCEFGWRVVGHIFHTIMDLEESDNLPVPREALGQVRMLLNTNVVLSKKFNDMRRAYLRELCIHRDRERVLSEQVQSAVASLQEDPIMFYEPLDFILDDASKRFICEVVEERIKLDMQTKLEVQAPEQEEVDEGDPEKAKMYAEMRKLRTEAAKNDAAAEKALGEAARSRAQLESAQKQIAALQEELEQMKKGLDDLQRHASKLEDEASEHSQKQKAPEVVERRPPSAKKVEDNSGQLEQELREQAEEISRLQQEVQRMERDRKKQAQELEKAKATIKELENKKPPPVEKAPVDIKPEKSTAELDDLRRQLEEQMKVVKELREANKALEKVSSEGKEKAKYRGPRGDPKDIDADIQSAVDKITEQHRQDSKRLEKENEKLKAEIERLKASMEESVAPREEKPEKVPRKKEVVVIDTDQGDKWKFKFNELQDQYDELQHEKEELQNQVLLLLDKIKKFGGEAAVAEAMAECKIHKLPPRKKRRKKAWERLYEDAQRRIADMQRRKEQLEKQERKLLINLASRVTDRRSLRQVENLTHLHKASIDQRNMFQLALTAFHSEHPQPDGSGGEGDETSGPEGDDEVGDLGAFFRGGFASLGGTGGSGGGALTRSDSWSPELIAAEFQRLRSENRILDEEAEKLRAEVQQLHLMLRGRNASGSSFATNSAFATSAVQSAAVAGVFAGGLGIGGVGISKRELFRAETGGVGGGDLGFARSRSPSPCGIGTMSPTAMMNWSASPLAQAALTSMSATAAGLLELPPRGRRQTPPPPPISAQRPSTGPSPGQSGGFAASGAGHLGSAPGTAAATAAPPGPWRQIPLAPAGAGGLSPSKTWPHGELKAAVSSANGSGAAATAEPISPSAVGLGGSLGKSVSASSLLGTGSAVPWRKEPALPIGRGGDFSPKFNLPAGWSSKTAVVSPTRRPVGPDAVLGRVPSMGVLEPIARPPASISPPTSPILGSAMRPSAADLSASEPLGAALVAGLGAGMPGGVHIALAKTAPVKRVAVAPKDSAHPYDSVKPKASGLCITALRSQEHLKSMSSAKR